jgi:hypothetical protein
MADLLDIAPAASVESVWIDGQRISVHAVSLGAIASIVARFPEVKALVNGGGADIVSRLFVACGAAVGPIIAAGCGHLGDEKYERHAQGYLPEQQLKLVAAIYRLTFPNGIGPFVEVLTGLVRGKDEGAPATIKLRSSKSSRSLSSLSDGAQASSPTMQ